MPRCSPGKTDAARQLYGDVSRSDPRNINALLGLAAIARQEGRTEDASRLYMSVLDLEPRNAYAQTGLIGIMGRADPLASESRLKQLITRDPSAALYFTLGNLYGDQARWAEAQQAYFQAHQLEAGNPDYTYNLAVSLEHIGQPKLAVNFYRQAVDQAQARGRAGFNLAQAQDRIRQLAAQQ
jgi:tetratricopeptide (TPR) repeat protein